MNSINCIFRESWVERHVGVLVVCCQGVGRMKKVELRVRKYYKCHQMPYFLHALKLSIQNSSNLTSFGVLGSFWASNSCPPLPVLDS